MLYIPVDLYRGSYEDLMNSSIMKNPNALSLVGDNYVFTGEDLYVGQKSLTGQKFIIETSTGDQSEVLFASVENPKAKPIKAGKGFVITGYKRDEATGERLTRVRNIIEADLPEQFDLINVKVLNASYADISTLKCTSTATIKTLEIKDSSFKLGYKVTGYVFDSSYLLDVSSYTMINYKPYIRTERSGLFLNDKSALHRGTQVENLTHGVDPTAYNKGNFGYKTFHEYYLTASDSSIGYSPNPAVFTDPAENNDSDDIEVMLEKDVYMGDYCNEMKIIASKTNVYKVLKTLLQKRVPPVYVGPTHAAQQTGFTTYEVGSTINLKITTTYTNPTPKELGATKENGYVTSRFDALTSKYNIDTRHGGNIISSVITKSGTAGLFTNFTENATEYPGLINAYKASGTIGKGAMAFKVTVNTETGPILKDNFLEFNAVNDQTAYTESGLNKAKGFYSTVEEYGYSANVDEIKVPPYETQGAHGAYSVGALNTHNNTFTQTFNVDGRYKYYVCSSTAKFDDVTWTKDLILNNSNIIKSGFVPNQDNGTLALGSITFPRGAKQCLVFVPNFFTKGTLTQIKNELGVDETVAFVYRGTIKCGGIKGNDNYLIDTDVFCMEVNAGASANIIYPTFTL